VAIVGVANLAVKVAELDPAIAFYERAGAEVRDRQHWRNGERVDVRLGVLDITLFTRAIYEPEVEVGEGFLHVALFTDDLDAEIDGHTVVWGPEVVSGVFGTRRIVFVDAPGNMRLEFMEQIELPPSAAGQPGNEGDVAGALLSLGSATVGESGGRILDRRLRATWPGAAIAAPCFPVRCAPGDNLAIHIALTRAPAGSALTVEIPDDREHGYWGEVLTVAAQARGVRGLVIDGCVRDTRAIQQRGFPTFATGTALHGTTKTGPGAIGEPAHVGGQRLAAGDWIVADEDGVVVIDAAHLDLVLDAAAARQHAESQYVRELQRGASTVDLLGLDPAGLTGSDPA
jgi:4-hydroxy-4-methyl-2-oxoglutarate aldolase